MQFCQADVSGSSNTAKRTSGSAGKCHVYAAGTGKECDRSGNLTQYGIICPVDSYDSKMVSEEDRRYGMEIKNWWEVNS